MPPIDPTILALLSIFGGVLLTIVAGGIGALVQHRREHSKWLRDQRIRVYSEHLAATDDFLRAAQNGDPAEAQVVAAASIRALSALQLAGPDKVFKAASAFQAAMHGTVKAYDARDQYRPTSLDVEANESHLARLEKSLSDAEDVRLVARQQFLALAQKEVGSD